MSLLLFYYSTVSYLRPLKITGFDNNHIKTHSDDVFSSMMRPDCCRPA